jgi:hypothetical protein
MTESNRTPLGSAKKRRNSVKHEANETEKELAKVLGGKRQPMSGALPGHKGDIMMEEFLLDSKQTRSNILNVTTRDLTKISDEAHQMSKFPGLVMTLQTPIQTPSTWVAIPLEIFAEIIERLNDECQGTTSSDDGSKEG